MCKIKILNNSERYFAAVDFNWEIGKVVMFHLFFYTSCWLIFINYLYTNKCFIIRFQLSYAF